MPVSKEHKRELARERYAKLRREAGLSYHPRGSGTRTKLTLEEKRLRARAAYHVKHPNAKYRKAI